MSGTRPAGGWISARFGLDGKGDLLAGAEAKASGKATLSGAEGTAGAFAGVKAGGRIAGDINGVGLGATAEGWAGPGVEAKFKVGDGNGKLELGGSVGASPILGGKVGFDLQIDQKVEQSAENAIHDVGHVAGEVGSGVHQVIDWL